MGIRKGGHADSIPTPRARLATNTAGALSTGPDGFDAIVVSDQIAAELASSLEMSRVVILGDGVNGLKPFAHLRKPLELDQLVRTVTACANNRR